MTFGRPSPEQRQADRAAQKAANLTGLCTRSRSLHKGVYASDIGIPASAPKENVAHHEGYRRLVAAMPCCWCFSERTTQCAHPNHGKGMALKTDDRRCFSLCATCHREFDQGGNVPRETRRDWADEWGEKTRALILSAGKWPSNLPLWEPT